MTAFREQEVEREVVTGPSVTGPVEVVVGDERPRARPSGRWRTALRLLSADLVGAAVPAALLGYAEPLLAVAVVVMVVAFRVLALYRRRLSLSVLDDAPLLLLGVATGLLVALAVRSTTVADPLGARDAVMGAGLLTGVLVARTLAYASIKAARRAGRLGDVGLIIGAGHVGIQLARNLKRLPEYGVTPIGFIDSRPRVADLSDLPAPLLGDYPHLAKIITAHRVRHVMVAFGSVRETQLVDILRTCDRLDCDISFVPRLFELHRTTRSMDDVWGVPLLRVRRSPLRSAAWKVKRLVDIVAAAAGLVVLAPVMLLCALSVRAEVGPSVLFRQERVGLDGRPIQILKFRTLAPADAAETDTVWNISQDPRLGPVGRFLRSTSLDELPQLWNILAGGMSLVGPRPERQHFVAMFSKHVPRYTARHRVPAGLTGWAQIHGLRGDTSIRDRAAFDNYYIENWSLWGDMKILLRTVGQVLRRGGA